MRQEVKFYLQEEYSEDVLNRIKQGITDKNKLLQDKTLERGRTKTKINDLESLVGIARGNLSWILEEDLRDRETDLFILDNKITKLLRELMVLESSLERAIKIKEMLEE